MARNICAEVADDRARDGLARDVASAVVGETPDLEVPDGSLVAGFGARGVATRDDLTDRPPLPRSVWASAPEPDLRNGGPHGFSSGRSESHAVVAVAASAVAGAGVSLVVVPVSRSRVARSCRGGGANGPFVLHRCAANGPFALAWLRREGATRAAGVTNGPFVLSRCAASGPSGPLL